MNPRYKTNSQWTEFPGDLNSQICDIFKQSFATELGSTTEVKVTGRVYSKEIILRVGLHKKGELRYHNFEVSIDHTNEESKVVENVYLAVDAIASLMAEYFENDEDVELPYSWMEYPFNGKKVWLQFSTENPDLEAEANKLLGLDDDDALLKNADIERSEDALDASEDEFDELVKNLDSESLTSKKKKDDLH